MGLRSYDYILYRVSKINSNFAILIHTHKNNYYICISIGYNSCFNGNTIH